MTRSTSISTRGCRFIGFSSLSAFHVVCRDARATEEADAPMRARHAWPDRAPRSPQTYHLSDTGHSRRLIIWAGPGWPHPWSMVETIGETAAGSRRTRLCRKRPSRMLVMRPGGRYSGNLRRVYHRCPRIHDSCRQRSLGKKCRARLERTWRATLNARCWAGLINMRRLGPRQTNTGGRIN